MTDTNFNQATEWMLVHEGGYVNHPKDPGGATNRGVIQRTYDGFRSRKGLPRQSVRHITNEEVWEIYRAQYWNAIYGDELPAGLDYAMYDFAVNSGPGRAAKFLQRRLGVTADGQIGQQTLGALRMVNDIEGLIHGLCYDRWNWMKRLRTFKTFGRGWTRRVMGEVVGAQPSNDHGVIDRATKLFLNVPHHEIAAPVEELPGKAMEEDTKLSAKIADEADGNLGLGAVVTAVPGLMTAASQVPEGPIQYALAAGIVVAMVIGGMIFYKKYMR